MIALLLTSIGLLLIIGAITAWVLYTDLSARSKRQDDLIVSVSQRLRSIETRPEITLYADDKVRCN